jgi:hypothetical protein
LRSRWGGGFGGAWEGTGWDKRMGYGEVRHRK